MAKKNPLLVNPPDLFRRVNRHMTSRAYKNRELIFRQGDKADAMYYIQNGTVKLTVVSKSGKKAVIAILQHGDFFGEGCLIGRSLRRCSATAIQPSTISKVKRA